MTAYEPIAAPGSELNSHDFKRVAAFIEQHSGIKTPPSKRLLVEGRLRRRARASGFASVADYCEHVFADPATLATEAELLVNALTTNKTDFFREPKHFDYLTARVLPALVAAGERRLRVWSAGCSTGAEPYTLAMLLDQFCMTQPCGYGILATDIDTEVLETARRGIYPTSMVEPVPALLRRRYMMAARGDRAEIRMVPELRAAIGFGRLNFMDPRYGVGDPMHIIFCRNVLIYFDQPTQEKVIRRLLDCLVPGGHLFLGHSETIAGMDLPVQTVAGTVFQKA
ncbi:protein-glutamate O-methyltransferase CheR [Sphingomonas sp. S-NIH.Pt15_0812]|jgi:chemotaxis protein methyltransferase CheR|uniref:CheR family methyltransferase n=1 Tax=Sphingomonas sp. S-NIH.Pt15_0812 TaxID=1920129 RepID=UPI000F7F950B|nr:protein-glutamate O-methyltransferase CheR [Sphingomonas sp. S-NIH.Pt15_0812]RSU46863.1 chemotaxis protein CheR [Sphingomonas sp. S-NIH.Pt15_0812]